MGKKKRRKSKNNIKKIQTYRKIMKDQLLNQYIVIDNEQYENTSFSDSARGNISLPSDITHFSSCNFSDDGKEVNIDYNYDYMKDHHLEMQQLLLLPNFKKISTKIETNEDLASYDDFDNTSFASYSFDGDEGRNTNGYHDSDSIGIKNFEFEKQQLLLLPKLKNNLIREKIN